MLRYLEHGPARHEGPLQAALLTARAKQHHIVAGFDPAVVPPGLVKAAAKGSGDLALADLLANLPALLKAHCATWIIDVDKEASIRLKLDFADEQQAKAAARAGHLLQEAAARIARQGGRKIEEQMNRPQPVFSTIGKAGPPAPLPIHRNLDQLAADVMQLSTAGACHNLADFVQNLPVLQQGSKMVVHGKLPMNMNTMIFALGIVSSLGTAPKRRSTASATPLRSPRLCRRGCGRSPCGCRPTRPALSCPVRGST